VSYTIRAADPPPLPETRRPRPNGAASIAQFHIHATRGMVAHDLQVQATESWFASPQNLTNPRTGRYRGWGGSADFVIGPDRREGGRIAIVSFGDWASSWARYAAGYGDSWRLQYPAAEVGISIELAQSADLEPIDLDTLQAAAWVVRFCNVKLRQMGHRAVLIQQLLKWDQLRASVTPPGIIGHQDLANGVKLGKTDPGDDFPWTQFIQMCGDEEPQFDTKALLKTNEIIAGSAARIENDLQILQGQIVVQRELLERGS
jgi:hypothetical protein